MTKPKEVISRIPEIWKERNLFITWLVFGLVVVSGGIIVGRSLAVYSNLAKIEASLPVKSMAISESLILEDQIRQVALDTYVHGMTSDLANVLVGQKGMPVVRKMLHDPNFPRRDNLVAFIDVIGGVKDREALLGFLRLPPRSSDIPEEDRALLIAPQALGKMASRGDQVAEKVLLAMTAHDNNGGVLTQASKNSRNPKSLRDDLLERALSGLAFAGTENAHKRLTDIADNVVVPAKGGRSLVKSAKEALKIYDELKAPTISFSSSRLDSFEDRLHLAAAGTLDTYPRSDVAKLTYANHVSLTNPMTDARLAKILSVASLRAGRGDFTEDVACCSIVAPAASGTIFGSASDGLDIIETNTELMAVLNNPVARVKVVRAINYCGYTATNIIGCGWISGDGIAVVRRSNEISEGVLWLHEYGHNVGLSHNTISSRYIMYSILSSNDGLTQSECNVFHNPSAGARITPILWRNSRGTPHWYRRMG